MDGPVPCQPRRFFDGGDDDESPDPASPPVIVLERSLEMAEQTFRMRRRIAYNDREYGELLVPASLQDFETDLASVPAVFTWLVPKSGHHLPAALLHDGLVHSPGQPPSYLAGRPIDRVEANRVFRDAMADTGTGVVRRWLMWSAVTTHTMISGVGTGWSPAEKWRWRLTAVLTIAIVVVLGVLATLELADTIRVVPWMPEGGWFRELTAGAAGAVVIPLALGLAWGPFRIAGVVLGIALALLLHVTVAIALLTGLYGLAEWLGRRAPTLAALVALAGIVVALLVFGLSLDF